MSVVWSQPASNPFIPGRRVTGPMFYGREEEIGRLSALLCDSVSPQHVQIVGEIRSGKSSLIAEFLRRNSDLPLVVLALDLSVHFRPGTTQDFYRQLVEYIFQAVERHAGEDRPIMRMAREVLAAPGLPPLHRLDQIFAEFEQAGLHVLVILDEFDYSLELFKLDERAFKYLRHIASNFSGLTLVTASRRSIFDIERDGGLSSNLAGVIPEHVYVSLLSRESAERLCREPAEREGVIWEPEVVEQVLHLSGCHACLIQRMGWKLFAEAREASLQERITLLHRAAPVIFASLFDDMERRLRRFGLWDALTSLVCAVPKRMDPAARHRLKQLGYLVDDGQDTVRMFTPLLESAVRERMRDAPVAEDARDLTPGGSEEFFDTRGVATDLPDQPRTASLVTPLEPEGAPLPEPPRSDTVRREIHYLRVSPAAFDVTIICGLRSPELKKVLDTGSAPWHELDAEADDPSTYHATVYTTARNSTLHVVAAAPSQMGMPAAAVLATKMVRRFRPRLVIMVGIAAGVKVHGRGFGDILAPECTFDYGAGKVSSIDQKLRFSPDPNPIGIGPVLRTRLRDWEVKRERLSRIRERWQHEPPPTALQLHVGPLGSGSAVIAADEPIEEVRSHWRKLIGIEMEAYGVHLACQEALHPPPMFLCLKSVCDFADGEKNDDWQHYAAYTAAQFCHLFVTEEWERLFIL